MKSEQPDYQSYLLRLWREKRRGRTAWRASLERPLAGQAQAFPSLKDAFEYLRQQTGAALDVGEDASATEARHESG